MVIPLAFSSGALSISSKAMAFAFPASARTCIEETTRVESSYYFEKIRRSIELASYCA